MQVDIIDMTPGQEPPQLTRDYRVIFTDTRGEKHCNVRLTIDFHQLRSFAKRALENDSGEAVLYFGAIKAKVQP